MEMPTPCKCCGSWFDLTEGYGGLTFETTNVTICSTCYNEQVLEKERVDKIKDLLSKQETVLETIQELTEEMDQVKQQLNDSQIDYDLYQSKLDGLEFKGDEDEYYEVAEKYY